MLKKILTKLKFRCRNNCGFAIEYDKAKDHYEKDCPKLNSKEEKEISVLKNQISEMKKEMMEYRNENQSLKTEIETIKKVLQTVIENQQQLKDENDRLIREIIDLKGLYQGKNNPKEIPELRPKKEESKENKIQSILRNDNSDIIQNQDQLQMLISTIENKLNKKVKGFKQLYKATKNGDTRSQFHSKCDGTSNTLSLFLSQGGYRFGGFTTASWDSSTGNKADKNAFLFSLDRLKVFHNIHPEKRAICCNGSYGPIFGAASDLYINNDPFLSSNETRTYTNSSNCTFGGDDYKLSERTDNSFYRLKELEVYEVLFE